MSEQIVQLKSELYDLTKENNLLTGQVQALNTVVSAIVEKIGYPMSDEISVQDLVEAIEAYGDSKKADGSDQQELLLEDA